MKKICAITAIAFSFVTGVHAQLVLSTTSYSQDFNGIGNSATATLPTAWKIGASSTANAYSSLQTAVTRAAGTSGTGALADNSSGGAYNFASGVTASSTDRAIGFLGSSSFASPRSIEFGITNNTGSTITSFDIGWNYEKYRSGTRQWTWNFFTSTDGINWTAVTAGDQNYNADAGNATIYNPPTSVSKSVDLNNLSIANGASYYFRWTLTGNGGSSNGQALAIDNFTLSATTAPVPEPSTYALLALGGVAFVVFARRRKTLVS